ncbi:MAG: hypothetical protein KJ929_06225, partial [Euryarchaeota archaeon]|nr:hypothetical protein [Euryarchaeota archaeon]
MEDHSMMTGKVVLVPFPFDTSKIATDLLETDIVLDSGRAGFNTTGLCVSSTLRLHRLMTVTTSLIKRELGELTPEMKVEVVEKLRKLFG